MDIITPAQRSELMGKVRSINTRPELIVRKIIFRMGYRYRLHAKDLPGRPDLVFRPREKVVFVNGCFWHFHKGCPDVRPPKSNRVFWRKKLEGNRKRDSSNYRKLSKMGWKYLIIWECQTADAAKLESKIRDFLGR
ncbi:MAG: DNA mismatch endonuclease Vsr [Nitrospinae bacterium]|nr:DNA mismatch endonuclease Vsr [Nitrospinota bacterium]